MTMDTESDAPTVDAIDALPLEQRAAAYAALEQELRQRLDDQPA